jgi:hypothetical protein
MHATLQTVHRESFTLYFLSPRADVRSQARSAAERNDYPQFPRIIIHILIRVAAGVRRFFHCYSGAYRSRRDSCAQHTCC